MYVEPFAGSLACLLARPTGGGAREIVCDLDGGIANFWRAVEADPDAVAYWADHPSIHQDLTARHKWLKAWFAENSHVMSEDPFFYDAQVAGFWVWGISLWIGGGWCTPGTATSDSRPMAPSHGVGMGVSAQSSGARTHDKRPKVQDSTGGPDVSAQSASAEHVSDSRPYVSSPSYGTSGARGVSAQRKATPGGANEIHVTDQIPEVKWPPGGRGVSAQRKATPGGDVNTPDKIPHAGTNGGGGGVSAQRSMNTRPDLVQWFRAIQERLKGVIVLNRSWESALTPTLLMHTPSSPKPPVGILMDPPYITDDRQAELYGSDADGSSTGTAGKAYLWAVEHGDVHRIAYCCHEGDFPVPDGWDSHVSLFGGIKDEERRARRKDLVMFSPACAQDPQMAMF